MATAHEILLRRVEQLEREARERPSSISQAWLEVSALREQLETVTSAKNEVTMRTDVADAVSRLGGPSKAAEMWGATVEDVLRALCFDDKPIAPAIVSALGYRYVEMYIPDKDADDLSKFYRSRGGTK